MGSENVRDGKREVLGCSCAPWGPRLLAEAGMSWAPLDVSDADPPQSISSKRNLLACRTGNPCPLLSLGLSPHPTPLHSPPASWLSPTPTGFCCEEEGKAGLQMASAVHHHLEDPGRKGSTPLQPPYVKFQGRTLIGLALVMCLMVMSRGTGVV